MQRSIASVVRAAPLAMLAVVIQVALGLVACAPAGNNMSTDGSPVTELSAEQRAAGWRLLFDGRTLNGWRGYRTPEVPASWRAVEGVLTKDGVTGDLRTNEQFGDFELAFDWKLNQGGNAGAFYRATEEYDHIYWSAPEYQLLDDANHPDGKNRLTSAGAAYGLYPAPVGVVKPAGQWNSTRLVVQGAHVEHWLNGQKLLEYELWSPDWEARVKASKFAAYPNYGRAKRGFIGFQGDHDGTLWLRNVRIRDIR